jgi:octaprenyl-diphosphate synthase
MDIQTTQALIADEMSRVDATIRDRLSSDVVLINQLSEYIIASGGKRLRPQLVVMSACAAGYGGDQHIELAAVIEFIHTATLLHDDVVDASELRRGRDTANTIWGNEAAVLTGDFLYSRAFEMMVDVGSMRVMEILAHTTNTIAEGEVMQLLNMHEPDVSEAQYLAVIHAKTAKLFEAATQLGAVLAGLPADQETALARYGMHLGTAFQIVDDVLDYSASAETLGKNIGDDLAEGKPTLPLIIVLRDGDEAACATVREAIEAGGRERIDEVLAAIAANDALDKSMQAARREADAAIAELAPLPDSAHKQALAFLADYAVSRDY